MGDIFEILQYPFVFVDSSHAYRKNDENIKKLTRKLIKKAPQRFWSLIEEIENSGREDTPYYERIIRLQEKGLISSLITCEAVNRMLIDSPTDIIHIFGTIKSISSSNKDWSNIELSKLVLWGENVHYKTYIRAVNVLLNASCIVADKTILSLQIGQLLLQHTTQHCPVFFLSDRKTGGNHTEYELPPKEFIQQLASEQQATG